MTAHAGTVQTPRSGRSFFGHPWGLATLFMTEMWERFSFYGMRAILVLYLVASVADGGLGYSAGTAAAIGGVYSAMVYLTALPGGWFADRVMGARRAVLLGGAVIAAGHFTMAVPVDWSLWPGLALIVCGTGLLKPNVSTLVGGLYSDSDTSRRDAGFSLFYVGINVGAWLGPMVCGLLVKVGGDYGWHLGFGAAAIGMTAGLIQYVFGRPNLRGNGEEPCHRLTPEEKRVTLRRAGLWLGVAAAALLVDALLGTLTINHVINALTALAFVVPAAYFVIMLRSPALTAPERKRVVAYIYLFLAAAVFWLVYDQASGVLNIFAEKHTNLAVFGWDIPASWTQSFNPIMILVLAPLFAALWVKLGPKLSDPTKFAIGLVLCGLGFMLMVGASGQANSGVQASLWWLVAVYLIQTCGELCLSPVGLSVSTRLAPPLFLSQVMGLWFLASAVGDAGGAQVQRLAGDAARPWYYFWNAMAAVVAGVVLFMFVRRIKRLMAERD